MELYLQNIFGSKVFQYVAGFTGTLGVISCEMHYGWTSPSLPILTNKKYKIEATLEEGTWLVIALIFGSIIGSIITAKIADFTGRKKLILTSAVPLLLGWLLIGFGNALVHLYVARVSAGLAVGILFTVVPMYLGEISDTKIRGTIGSILPVFVVAGFLFVNLFGVLLPINHAAFVSMIFPLTLLLTFYWMPESPTFLILNGKEEEAKDSLITLYGPNSAQQEFERLQEELQNLKQESFWFMFKDEASRKALLIATGLRTIQQLSGAAILNFYCKTIFEEMESFLSPNISTVIYFLLQLITTIISSLIVDKIGRIRLLMFSAAATGVTLFTLGFFLHLKTHYSTKHIDFIPIVAMFFYVIFFNIGIRTIPLLMLAEIFPSNVKSVAVSFTAVYFNLLSTGMAIFFSYALKDIGMYVAFYVFAVFCFLGMFFIMKYVPETKGKTFEEIQRELSGEKVSKPLRIPTLSVPIQLISKKTIEETHILFVETNF